MLRIDPVVKRFLVYIKPYKWWIFGATICGFLKFNIPLLFPMVLKQIIDLLTGDSSVELAQINQWLGILLVIYVAWAVAAFYRSTLADAAGQRMVFDLRFELYQHLQKLPLSFFEKRQTGAISSRLLNDINIAQNYVGNAFTNAIMDLSTLVLISVILINENIHLAIASLVIIPVYLAINNYFKQAITRASKKAQNKLEEITGQVHEQIGAVSVIQSFTGEKTEQMRFFRESRTYLDYLLANVKNNAMALTVIGFITSVAPILVIWYGVYEVANRHMTAGALVAFYAYLGMLYQPLSRLSELNILLANSRSAMERIFEVFDISPHIEDDPDAISIGKLRGEIVLRDVSYVYEKAAQTLTKISLHIPAGSMTAVVGRSGAGKSTLIKLIPRFIDASEGLLSIDGIDIRKYRLKALRRNIALVAQDPILFSGTIVENIVYGRRNASMKDVFTAAAMANADEFIKQLPDSYYTVIGERGVTLSGGQKQRIALARAFLKDAPIILLDEATSALDSESERVIQQAMQRLLQDRTSIVIAHRLSTVIRADNILVIDKGKLVQQGKHEDLMHCVDGLYRRLYDEQFSG